MRVLAIDFGMRRMGLAVSDALGITAQGLPTLPRTRLDDDLRKIQELTEEYSTERVIVGNPLGHGGGETTMSRQAAEFAEKLRRRVNCPVDLWDERLTSVEANRALARHRPEPGQTPTSGGSRGGDASLAKLPRLPLQRAKP